MQICKIRAKILHCLVCINFEDSHFAKQIILLQFTEILVQPWHLVILFLWLRSHSYESVSYKDLLSKNMQKQKPRQHSAVASA